ncbi:MAG: LuxR C-terminal-related transcriptional regulator [Oscillospiraceae bacterium]|nr:LuxR C-terminal-related transcriptional regulator [Oscillospiraceae bacterium]
MDKHLSNNKAEYKHGYTHGSPYLARPRLCGLLSTAMNYPLVVVCAGAGYGKTRAVHDFFQENRAVTTWLQISERDNIPTRFWESYTGMVSISWPGIGARLSEIGFPDTEEAFMKYCAIMHEIAVQPGKHVRVFDDFHLLTNPAVLRFFERAVSLVPSNVTLLVITRMMPQINMIGMIMQERIFTISEEELRFSEGEIAEYYGQMNLSVTRQGLRNIYEDTQGWAFAVNLIGRSLTKETKYERCALEAMKANIYRLIEAELAGTISEKLRDFLLQISLIDHLAASLIRELAGSCELVKEMETLNAYIRYDLHLDTYTIHHLFLDYLRQNQHLLPEERRSAALKTAGKWCDSNGYHVDAFSYYEKAGDYASVVGKVAAFNAQMPPDMAQIALEIFENAPSEAMVQNPLFPGVHIKCRINNGKINEDTMNLAKMYAEAYEAQPESPERNRALAILYGELAFLSMLLCTSTDKYDFAGHHLKMAEYYSKNPFEASGTYNIVPISTWASLVGTQKLGAQEDYIQALTLSIPSTSIFGKGFFVGFDDLAWGELYFYRGQLNEAEQHLKQAVDKAQKCEQYSTQNRALAYLMRIAFCRGDLSAATEKLKAMELMLNDSDHGARYTIYDIATGFYYLTLGQADKIPAWLKDDFSPYAHPAFIENYANRIKAQYHYQKQQYNALLAFIETQTKKNILFGKIELKLLAALIYYKLKRRGEAMRALEEAFELAEPNNLVALFTQYSKDMRTLTAAALRDEDCAIPRPRLEEINRKASAYAKRQSHMVTQYNIENNITKQITLTQRETKVLSDLSHGLSRTEIAVSQNISLNTVKMVINIIYDKLCVTNLPDAIRIGVDKKIV